MDIQISKGFIGVIILSPPTNPNTKIWGHGSIFDCTILESAYEACNMVIPWKFWNVRDTRTLFDISNFRYNNLQVDESLQKHHALHDCYRQIIGVKEAIKNIN